MGAEKAVEDGLIPLLQYVKTKQALDLYRMSTSAPTTLTKLDNYWFVGAPGTGKSRSARERWPVHFNKSCNKWWDGYRNEDTILIDDLDRQRTAISHDLKLWADHYPFKAESKGSCSSIRPGRIVVTSNYTISELFETDQELVRALQRRFNIVRFESLFCIKH